MSADKKINNRNDATLPDRVTTLEVTMNNLAQDLQETSRTVKDMARNVTHGFETIRSEINKSGKPNWSLIIGGISILGGVITFLFKPLEKDVHYMDRINILNHQHLEQTIEQNRTLSEQRDQHMKELIDRDYEQRTGNGTSR